MNFYRDTFAQVDLTQLARNITYLKQKANKHLIAVIKANGYGHGAYYLAKKAMEAGAYYLAVSSLDEAITLRTEGIADPILILGYTRLKDVGLALFYNLTLTVTSLDWCKELSKMIPEGKLKVHVKIDTGMNRLGMRTVEEVQEGIALLREKGLFVEGIYTHYACSDEADDRMTTLQYERFRAIMSQIKEEIPMVHASNSDASVHFAEEITNCVRVGIAMVGISTYETELKPILSLYTRLTNVKQIQAGEGISYSQSYHAKEAEWIGTIPIGYADGWIRQNQGRYAYLNGQPCEFVGKICMDQCMIRLPWEYPVDTLVELIGEHVSMTQMAQELHTIPYEVMCLLTDRVPRVYLEQGQVVAIDNPRMRYHHSK